MYKKLLILSILSLILTSCSNENDIEPNDIVGSWKLIEVYADPGDGSGSFNPVDSNKIIEFKSNGRFQSNSPMCNLSPQGGASSSGNYSETMNTLSPEGCDFDIDLSYELKNGELIIYYFCIEGCGEKFEKIK